MLITTSVSGTQRTKTSGILIGPLADLYILLYSAATVFRVSSAIVAVYPARQSRVFLSRLLRSDHRALPSTFRYRHAARSRQTD